MPKRTSSNKKRQSVDDEGDGDDGDDGFRDGDNEQDDEDDQPTSSSSSGMGRISLSGVIGMITGGFRMQNPRSNGGQQATLLCYWCIIPGSQTKIGL
jgi:hypothetical protein